MTLCLPQHVKRAAQTRQTRETSSDRCRLCGGSSDEPFCLLAPLPRPPCTHSRAPLAGGLLSVSTTRLFSRSIVLLFPGMEGFRCTCTLPLAVSSTLHMPLQSVIKSWVITACIQAFHSKVQATIYCLLYSVNLTRMLPYKYTYAHIQNHIWGHV